MVSPARASASPAPFLYDRTTGSNPHGGLNEAQRRLMDSAIAVLKAKGAIAVEAESVTLIAELVRRGSGVARLLSATAATLSGARSVTLPKDAQVPIALCRNASVRPSYAAPRLMSSYSCSAGDLVASGAREGQY